MLCASLDYNDFSQNVTKRLIWIGWAILVYLTGQLVGVFKVVALVTEEMSVTSPKSFNTQPVAGMIAIGWGLGKTACVLC